MKLVINNKEGLIVHSVYEGENIECPIFEKLRELKVFEGKKGQIYVNASQDSILVGLGKKKNFA